MPLLVSGLVTAVRRARASRTASSRMARRSAVISSASISLSPRPNRCGASRLSGRVATSPPVPAAPLRTAVAAGTAVHQAGAEPQLGVDVAVAVVRTAGPGPGDPRNLRWKIWRPRRTARAGSRAMMYAEESGVFTSPRPAPICSASDLAMPALAVFGFCVRSIDCPRAGPGWGSASRSTRTRTRTMVRLMTTSSAREHSSS